MKKYSAHYVFPLVSPPLKNGIIVVDDDGFFLNLIDTGGEVQEIDRLEFHSGILIPEINGLTIAELRNRQEQSHDILLNELLLFFNSETENGFVLGQKASVFLIFPLDLLNLRVTEKSKLKKLV